MNTDKLKSIIMKFDDFKQNFVKAVYVSNNKIEMDDFCSKMLYRIRYIFSKMGRLLNLHENESIRKWLAKDNNRLLKKITEKNPKFIDEMKTKNISLINIDSHKCKNAKYALMFHFKESIKKWRVDIDIANFQRKQEPDIQCRICNNYIAASQIDYHNQLCLKRIHTKEKASKVDKQFMEILNKITKEILSLSRAKGSSAIIKKRSFFKEQDNPRKLPINSPLITNRGMNRLQDVSKELTEKNKTSTPSMPSRSGPVDFVKDGQLQMNKLVRNDNVASTDNKKPDDFRGGFQFRTFDRSEKNSLAIRKPPLPKEKKEEPSIVKEKPEEKSEGKINTTMETTPDINEDRKRKEEIKRMPQKEEEKEVKPKAETNTGNAIRPKDFYSIPEGNVKLFLLFLRD